MAKYSETSTRCARTILKAWRRHNLVMLDQKLAKAATVESGSEDAGECERWELLTGIAGEFRQILASGHLQDALVLVTLLENLAQSAAEPARRAAAFSLAASAFPASIQ